MIDDVRMYSGGGEGGETSVGVTDDSVGAERERGTWQRVPMRAEICTEEVDSDITWEIEGGFHGCWRRNKVT
jgi:hypothetical protein